MARAGSRWPGADGASREPMAGSRKPMARAGSAGFQPALFSLLRSTSNSRLSPRTPAWPEGGRRSEMVREPGADGASRERWLPAGSLFAPYHQLSPRGAPRRVLPSAPLPSAAPDLGEVVRSEDLFRGRPGRSVVERIPRFSSSGILAVARVRQNSSLWQASRFRPEGSCTLRTSSAPLPLGESFRFPCRRRGQGPHAGTASPRRQSHFFRKAMAR